MIHFKGGISGLDRPDEKGMRNTVSVFLARETRKVTCFHVSFLSLDTN